MYLLVFVCSYLFLYIPMNLYFSLLHNFTHCLDVLMAQVFTWLGRYGHRLQKGTHLWAALPGAEALYRKMTKKRKTAFLKKQENRAGGKKDYTMPENGTVSGGPDLQSHLSQCILSRGLQCVAYLLAESG